MTSSASQSTGSKESAQMVREHIRAMSGYAPGEQPQAGKFIKLNTNENPFPPADSVIHAIQQAASENLNLYPDPSGYSFRKAAADLFGVEPDWIICGNGSDDILTILTRAFVGPDEKLRLLNPSYSLYKTLAEIQDAQSDVVNFTADWKLPDGFFNTPDDVRLIYLPNPNSPSGTVISPGELAEYAAELKCPLVIDEAYADFADEDCVQLVREFPNIIITRTLSKSYSLAGLRFGFGIANPQVIAELHKVRDSYNCDRLAIAGATAAISDQNWLTETVSKIRATRCRLTDELSSLGFDVTESHANFVWCKHPNMQCRTLYEKLKEQRILIRYMEYPDWGDGIRITVGSETQIDALLTILKQLVPGS